MGNRRSGSKVGKVLRKLTYIAEFDKMFDGINCSSELRVNNGAYYLTEEADLWWTQRKDELLKRPNFGWDEFKEALREKFYPFYLRKKKCMEFTNLIIGNMNISEYYNRFIELMRFAPEVVPTKTLKAQRFDQGLTLTLQGNLGGVTFETLDEVYGCATHLYRIKGREMEHSGEKRKRRNSFLGGEKRHKPNGDKRENKGNFGKRNDRQETNVRGNGDQENSEKPKRLYFYRRCEKNHPGKDCESNPVTCHYCQKQGHREYECFKMEYDVKAWKIQESRKNPFKPPQSNGPQIGTSSNGGNVPQRIFIGSSFLNPSMRPSKVEL
ncbi:uncharacterized protein LOC110692400 [Chenopodium quinoa]|uniref:uncharacterized protein LOC110692400 n=1 Tax=Chenopodium quinoa TaxID=63459 RepID=UPI000B770D88|nr:uncharacterized protein LOC110692400 [Chenopodium quinoa]